MTLNNNNSSMKTNPKLQPLNKTLKIQSKVKMNKNTMIDEFILYFFL